jgi:hypothetical protein
MACHLGFFVYCLIRSGRCKCGGRQRKHGNWLQCQKCLERVWDGEVQM